MCCWFYSHVNYSVTKIVLLLCSPQEAFYSHVNYSVTKIEDKYNNIHSMFYSHVNYSVTKIQNGRYVLDTGFTVT